MENFKRYGKLKGEIERWQRRADENGKRLAAESARVGELQAEVERLRSLAGLAETIAYLHTDTGLSLAELTEAFRQLLNYAYKAQAEHKENHDD